MPRTATPCSRCGTASLTEPGSPGPVGGLTWAALATALAIGALIGYTMPADGLDWQPRLAWQQPWRWWTAAFVHLSAGHLAANLAGCAVVAAFGVAAHAGARDAGAWLAAWPLGHVLLIAQPALQHYGGLSGVLHAGVAVVALGLLLRGEGRRRAIGAAVLAGLLVKLTTERPWAGTLQTWPGWDIVVAPGAHVAGTAAGLACALVAWATSSRRPAPTMHQ
jgi:rhomboid family GlyGly-CTERM serine protease